MERLVGKGLGLAIAVALTGCGGGGGGTSAPPTSTTPPAPPAISAGIFVQPATFVPATQSTLASTVQARFASTAAQDTSATIPAFSAATAVLTIPNVSVNGTMYGQALLHHDGNGVFSLTSSSATNASITQTASKYADGNLTLASVMVDGHRYTNAKLHLEADGKFKLVLINDPIIVQKTSYLNAKNLNIPFQSLPVLYNKSQYFSLDNAYALADFFQDGTLSLVSKPDIYDPTKPQSEAKAGLVHFWKKDASGNWIDATSQLLADATGCLHSRKAVVADFNNDGKPDVFMACTGFDGGDFPGEKSRILLSQVDGTYKNVAIDATANGYSHGAAAADVNHDGNIDIVIADFKKNGGSNPIYFLMGNGDGTFNADYARVSTRETSYKPWFTVELIDIDNTGNYSILAGGHESFVKKDGTTQSGSTTKIIKGDASGTFISSATNVPGVNDFAVALDFVVDSGSLYVLRTPMDPFYFGSAIQKVNLQTMASSLLYQHTGYIDQTKNLVWANWIMPFQDKVVSVDSAFGISVSK